MRKYFLISLVTFAFICLGCTSTYEYQTNNPTTTKLEKNKIVAIATSEDGFYGSDIYEGSGKILSMVVRQQIKIYSSKVTILENKIKIEDFSEKEIEEYDYIVIPEILHWEDRATAWSGLPARISFSIQIYNNKKELLKSTILSGKSASMTLGSTDPGELIEEPLKVF